MDIRPFRQNLDCRSSEDLGPFRIHRQRPQPIGQGTPNRADESHREEADGHGAGRADIHSSMSLHGAPPDITLATSIFAQQKNARKRLFTSPPAQHQPVQPTHAEAGGPCDVASLLLQFVALNRLGRDRPKEGLEPARTLRSIARSLLPSSEAQEALRHDRPRSSSSACP